MFAQTTLWSDQQPTGKAATRGLNRTCARKAWIRLLCLGLGATSVRLIAAGFAGHRRTVAVPWLVSSRDKGMPVELYPVTERWSAASSGTSGPNALDQPALPKEDVDNGVREPSTALSTRNEVARYC